MGIFLPISPLQSKCPSAMMVASHKHDGIFRTFITTFSEFSGTVVVSFKFVITEFREFWENI